MRGWWLAGKVLVAAVLLAMAGGAALIYTGGYPVGADEEHWPLTQRLLEMARDRSVTRAARSVEVRLPRLDGGALLSAVVGFEDMCAGCHAPPGRNLSPLAAGLNPPPPDLVRAGAERAPEELFWVTRSGIRMTGMPAWGLTHSDGELWPLVALILRFPELGEGEYERLLATAQAADMGHDHVHDRDQGTDDDQEPGPSHEHENNPEPDKDHDQDQGHRHEGHAH